MKIRAGWYAVACALLCVRAGRAVTRPSRANEMYIGGTRWSSDPESTIGDYGYGSVSASKLSEMVEYGPGESEEERPSTMRAITTRTKSSAYLLPLIVEPEAEMLPPGYKGVKPPGVSHMELVFVKPQASLMSGRENATPRAAATDDEEHDKLDGEFDRDGDARYAPSKHETQIARNDHGSAGLVVFRGLLSDDSERDPNENERTEYGESSVTGRSRSRSEAHAKKYEDEVVGKKSATTGYGG